MRKFKTGATRDNDTGKPDYDGFLSEYAVPAFGRYMHRHRLQADGKLRDSDNWKRGMPKEQYIKSLWRHVIDLWREWRGDRNAEKLEDLCCACMFNIQGFLHELLKEENNAVHPEKRS